MNCSKPKNDHLELPLVVAVVDEWLHPTTTKAHGNFYKTEFRAILPNEAKQGQLCAVSASDSWVSEIKVALDLGQQPVLVLPPGLKTGPKKCISARNVELLAAQLLHDEMGGAPLVPLVLTHSHVDADDGADASDAGDASDDGAGDAGNASDACCL